MKKLLRQDNQVMSRAKTGIMANCPAVLPDVAMLVASPRRSLKWCAIVVDTNEGAIAANATPPIRLKSIINCHGSVINEQKI